VPLKDGISRVRRSSFAAGAPLTIRNRKGGAAMGRRWCYKFGGSTTSSHPYCPARVLLGGRCPKSCPERDPYSDCSRLPIIDHPSLETLPSGEECFISRVYYSITPNNEEFRRLRAVCEIHGLTITVEEKPWHGMDIVSHIKITKKQEVVS